MFKTINSSFWKFVFRKFVLVSNFGFRASKLEELFSQGFNRFDDLVITCTSAEMA